MDSMAFKEQSIFDSISDEPETIKAICDLPPLDYDHMVRDFDMRTLVANVHAQFILRGLIKSRPDNGERVKNLEEYAELIDHAIIQAGRRSWLVC